MKLFCGQPTIKPMTNDFYDFSPHIAVADERLGSSSQFCIRRAYRGTPIGFYLFAMGYYWAMKKGLAQIICVINPKIQTYMRRYGYKPLASQLYDAQKRLPMACNPLLRISRLMLS